MTDQPDRQDEDGLLRDLELIGHALAKGGHPSSTTHAFYRIKALLAPPTRDGAEGAGDIARCIETIEKSYVFKDGGISLQKCGEWIYLKELIAAPPKPAPDAMREAEAALRLIEATCHVRAASIARDAIRSIEQSRSSAPVPPADGARLLLTNLTGFVAGLRQHEIDPELREEILNKITAVKIGLSPSPAVAAEPVAWQPILNFAQAIPSNVDDATGVAYVPFAKAMGVAASLTAGQFRRLLATPPVKGNREALCEAIRAYCRTLGKTVVHTSSDGIDRIYYSGLSVQGIADAVIPVQPGAGESDICPYCDSEMEKDACSACGRERVPPEGYSRQAPHSSSEGGR